MNHFRLIFTAYLLCCYTVTVAQPATTPQDSARVHRLLITLTKERDLPLNSLLVKAGKGMLGIPYVANTLEGAGEEKLVVNLRGLDCTTFVETALALALTAQTGDTTFTAFAQHLQNIRYRNGSIKGYASRLHYFTDWLHEGQQQGRLEVMTPALGGQPYLKKLNFMTTHRNLYSGLKDDSAFAAMQRVERVLNVRSYYFLPKAAIAKVEDQLQEGDVVAITTPIKGLDVVHVGIAVKKQGRVYMLHASQTLRKVVVSDQPLTEYLAGNAGQSGIMVGRPKGMAH